jgi:PAS domain S-box-containing protein
MQTNSNCAKCNDSLRLLIDLVPDPLTLIDSNGKIAYVNEQLQKMCGYTKEQLLGKTPRDLGFISPDCHDLLERNAKNRQAGQMVSPYEIKVTTSNEVRLLEVTGSLIKNEGQLFNLVIFHDVTERNQNQKALQNKLCLSEEKLQGICNSIREAIILVDQNAKVTFWNLAAQKTFGYTQKEALGRIIHDLVVPVSMCSETKQSIPFCVETFAQTGLGYFAVSDVELIGRHKDGREFPVELSISPINLNGNWHAIGLVKDITNRKKHDQKLKDAEQRYRTLFNQSPLGVMVIDPSTGRYVDFNDIAHRQLGYSRDEFEAMTLFDVQAEKTKPELHALIEDMLRQGGGQLETTHKTKTGETRNVLVNIRAFQSLGRQYLNCICDDITETKQAQLALKESMELSRAISTYSTDAIILSDEHGKVIYWNPAAEQTFHCSEEEALGKTITELIVPSGPDYHCEMLKDILTNPSSKKYFQFNALRKDGSIFPMDLSVVCVELKGKQCLLLTIRDVTGWKMMEEALRQERDLLEAMAANVNAGLAIINRDYKIVWANRLLKKIHGKTDLENEYCYTIFSRAHAGLCRACGAKKIFEDGAAIDRHDYKIKKGKTSTWIELIVTPIKDKNGKVVAALELAVDITERKQLQNKQAQRLEGLVQKKTAQLKATQAELVKSERLAAIGELASMVGHDLRNPLTGIKNSAYFMKKKGSNISTKQYDEMLETIDKCVDYSNKIIRDLLDYSREIRLHSEEHSLKILLTDCLSILEIPVNIEIENSLKDDCIVELDADKIKRVFLNLLKNAIDAMPNGGKIAITSRETSGALEVSFTDTGAGISKEALPKLFAPLFTTKAQGMGFGLAICKRLMEAHGGAITCQTVEGKGTTFTLTLPIEKKNQSGGENIWLKTQEFLLPTMMKP